MRANHLDVMVMAQGLRVLLVEDSKVLTERLTEAIRQIPEVELIGTADTEAGATAAGKGGSLEGIILGLHRKQGARLGRVGAWGRHTHPPPTHLPTNCALPE